MSQHDSSVDVNTYKDIYDVCHTIECFINNLSHDHNIMLVERFVSWFKFVDRIYEAYHDNDCVAMSSYDGEFNPMSIYIDYINMDFNKFNILQHRLCEDLRNIEKILGETSDVANIDKDVLKSCDEIRDMFKNGTILTFNCDSLTCDYEIVIAYSIIGLGSHKGNELLQHDVYQYMMNIKRDYENGKMDDSMKKTYTSIKIIIGEIKPCIDLMNCYANHIYDWMYKGILTEPFYSRELLQEIIRDFGNDNKHIETLDDFTFDVTDNHCLYEILILEFVKHKNVEEMKMLLNHEHFQNTINCAMTFDDGVVTNGHKSHYNRVMRRYKVVHLSFMGSIIEMLHRSGLLVKSNKVLQLLFPRDLQNEMVVEFTVSKDLKENLSHKCMPLLNYLKLTSNELNIISGKHN